MARRLKGSEQLKIMECVSKIPCKYGKSCYRKSLDHLKKYSHPSKEEKTVPEKRKHEEDKNKDSFHKSKFNKNEDVNESQVIEDNEVKNASETEDTVEISSPDDVRNQIKEKFLVEMPEDFYLFWEFCQTVNKTNPEDALVDLLGLQLVGPFDVLSGKLNMYIKKQSDFLCHWRYYFDPPEFQTVLRRDDSLLFHIGYFRDVPSEPPDLLASNCAAKDCTLHPMGDNIFAAVNIEIMSAIGKAKDKNVKAKLSNLQTDLQKFTSEKHLSLDQKTAKMKARDKKVVAKTFHGMGIVVPVDKNDVGYRPLPESNANLKKLLTRIKDSKTEKKEQLEEQLQKIITFIQFANDECDYGMGLEFCIDLFCFGHSLFHPNIFILLPLAYELLGRSEYAVIIQAHLENRRQGGSLSIIS